jgi:hypothetical protein
VDSLISNRTTLELCEAFFASGPKGAPPLTHSRLQHETLSGTWCALLDGAAGIAVGGVIKGLAQADMLAKPIWDVPFVFAVEPHHPLSTALEP